MSLLVKNPKNGAVIPANEPVKIIPAEGELRKAEGENIPVKEVKVGGEEQNEFLLPEEGCCSGIKHNYPRFWMGCRVLLITALFLTVAAGITYGSIFGTGGFEHAITWLKEHFWESIGIAAGSGAYLTGTFAGWVALMVRESQIYYEGEANRRIQDGKEIDSILSHLSRGYLVKYIGESNQDLADLRLEEQMPEKTS